MSMRAPWIAALYVCENCGRLGPLSDFQGDCRPGWTHGRLMKVNAEASAARPFEGDWRPTPEQRKHASDTLLALWQTAEDDGDDALVEVVKKMLRGLGLPWVPLPAANGQAKPK